MTRALSASMLSWLRCFDAAARHLSFQNAASELSITPGAVSQQIKLLEETLGCTLFERRQNRMTLTPAGLHFAPAVTASYASLRQAIARLDDLRAIPRISVSCSPSFALQWLTPRISRFVARHPGTELSVFGELVILSPEKMRSCGVDFAIRYDTAGVGPGTGFLDEYLLPVASPDFLLATSGIGELGEIDGRHLLHDNMPWGDASGDDEWRYWFESFGQSTPDHMGGSRFNMSQMAITSAIAGKGIAMGRLALVQNELETGRLVPVSRSIIPAPAEYQYVPIREDRHSRAVFDWLVKEAKDFVLLRNRTMINSGIQLPAKKGRPS